jgi:predicted dehydrogenase
MKKEHRLGVVMNGVTGRMGKNQHLLRSIAEIVRQGGVRISDEECIVPEPVLVGRSAAKLEALAAQAALPGLRVTTDLDAALADARNAIYFDAQLTSLRAPAVKRALEAGKHVYCEKPTAETVAAAYDLYLAAKRAGRKHGVVQDKLWLPGIRKLAWLVSSGFFGEILSVRGEFGYWVFTGETVPPQRPSWNYRREDGGGIILDMFAHWRYLIENLFGAIRSVSCLGATHVKRRWDEAGRPYTCTAEDAAYATFELASGAVCHFNSSWAVRVRRDDLLAIQVDGTHGSAVAGLRDCRVQHSSATPRPVWNPDVPSPIDYAEGWTRVPDHHAYDNAFKVQWELFLRHVVRDEPFPWNLLEAARGVQLADAAQKSWRERRVVDLEPLQA